MPLVRSGLAALLVALAASPVVFRALIAMKSRQNVSRHLPEHAAKQGTPTMGGFIVLIGVAAGMAVLRLGPAPWILLAGFALIGFADDYLVQRFRPESRGLSWMPKLVAQFAFAFGAAFAEGLAALPSLAFVLTVLFYSNAFNFADGMDTLATGIGLLLAAALITLEFAFLGRFGPGSLVMIALIGGFIPFWFLNAPPARVFMGDVGALPIGALFGWAGFGLVQSAPAGLAVSVCIAVAIASAVLLVEIVPVPMQIGWVKLTGKRLFRFKTPVHHEFQSAGWPETRVVALFHVAQAVCTFFAFAWAVVCVFSLGQGALLK
ncbi:MAG: hypothetical protein KIT11_11790 [Fimbriimonadaceae bacterium]|nr:hypothetical protein [Fimbriimonadaceae bacterium]QYK55284.1 MAG: hypothetical protein KF733_09745 [Fimbriimonadaceae bacterium]